jgi:hypothetical protein
MEDRQLYVAKFRSHPLGGDRYAKDFKYNLTLLNKEMWDRSDEAARLKHMEWSLNHAQFHYSTANMQQADLWECDKYDAEARAILEKYAPVDFISVSLTAVPI